MMTNIKDADEEGLSARGEDDVLHFLGSPKSGKSGLYGPVEEGDEVTLNMDGQDIHVKSVKLDGPDKYTGIIYGFENPMGLEAGNLRIDDSIRFRECHIFLCRKRS